MASLNSNGFPLFKDTIDSFAKHRPNEQLVFVCSPVALKRLFRLSKDELEKELGVEVVIAATEKDDTMHLMTKDEAQKVIEWEKQIKQDIDAQSRTFE